MAFKIALEQQAPTVVRIHPNLCSEPTSPPSSSFAKKIGPTKNSPEQMFQGVNSRWLRGRAATFTEQHSGYRWGVRLGSITIGLRGPVT